MPTEAFLKAYQRAHYLRKNPDEPLRRSANDSPLTLVINCFKHGMELCHLSRPLDKVSKFAAVHDALHVAQGNHHAQTALYPLVHSLQLGSRLLPLLLVDGLLERLHERLGGVGDGDGMADAHGYHNLVRLELNVLDVGEGLGEDGDEGGYVQAPRTFLQARREDGEGCLPEWDRVVDGVLERPEVDHTLQVQYGELVQGRQYVLLHKTGHQLRRVVNGGVNHEEARGLDAQIVLP
mmetsp:Transcript_12876/g.24042  ORF Transcript_12876/g.24042 Transcript_12876/m.24042 type:complete len:236 (-) Transcript_12876:1115-1822(-)